MLKSALLKKGHPPLLQNEPVLEYPSLQKTAPSFEMLFDLKQFELLDIFQSTEQLTLHGLVPYAKQPNK